MRATGALLSTAPATRLPIDLMAGLLLAPAAAGLLPRTILAGLSALRGLARLLRLARAREGIVAWRLALLLLAPRRIARRVVVRALLAMLLRGAGLRLAIAGARTRCAGTILPGACTVLRAAILRGALGVRACGIPVARARGACARAFTASGEIATTIAGLASRRLRTLLRFTIGACRAFHATTVHRLTRLLA